MKYINFPIYTLYNVYKFIIFFCLIFVSNFLFHYLLLIDYLLQMLHISLLILIFVPNFDYLFH